MSFSIQKHADESALNETDDKFKTPIRPKAFFPKRITELSPLESSDDESEKSADDILNNSFIGTPSLRSLDKVENDQNSMNRLTEIDDKAAQKKNDSASRQLNFQSISNNNTKERPIISLFSKIHNQNNASVAITKSISPIVVSTATSTIMTTTVVPTKSNSFEEKTTVTVTDVVSVMRKTSAPIKSNLSDERPRECIDSELCTPKLTSKSDESSNQSTNDFSCTKIDSVIKSVSQVDLKDETPYKAFQIPSARRLPSSNRLMTSAASKKCRTTLENEFRSQKVLFTTPSAVSRPAIKLMNHVGLDDSLNCYKASPLNTHLSPVKEERCVNTKAKVQLNLNDMPSSSANIIDSKSLINKDIAISKENDNLSNEKTEEKKKVLRINGKEFIIHKKLGQGGSSTVFLAEHKDSKMEVALKVVSLRCDPSLLEGYVREVKILASLQDKENVIRLYEYALISSENILYMVMEKGDSDLRNVLQTYKSSLPLYTLMSYWHQMLQCVEYIHRKDVIHSDLKPENFLIVRDRLKLIDFGISSKMAVDATSIIKYSQVGTFNYISPEALLDTSNESSPMGKRNQPKIKISPKSDVWSLGCILYLLIYKKTPFAHIKNMYAKMQAIIDPKKQIEYPELANFYPQMLLEMLKRCLKFNPKERASVAELLDYPFDMIIPINRQLKS